MKNENNTLKIGFSACFFHADKERAIFKNKTLLYTEESMLEYVMYQNALPVLLPRSTDNFSAEKIVSMIDGLLLQGGSDVSPSSYNEEALKEEWQGDATRDEYEIALILETIKQKKPILGICRGLQILNVALGGSLYQDINEQISDFVHRDWSKYEDLEHNIIFENNSNLANWYQSEKGRSNSIHHQAIKELGKGLQVEAKAEVDSIIEAISLKDVDFVFGVQWHPEFQKESDSGLLDNQVIMKKFLEAAQRRLNTAN